MHAEPKQNTPSADGASERSNADGGVAEWPRTGAFEDRSTRGLERPRTGAAEGSTNEQDEHRSDQSGQAPRTSAAEDQITRTGVDEGSDPRGSNPRVSEPRGAEQRGPIRGFQSRGIRSGGPTRGGQAEGGPAKEVRGERIHRSGCAQHRAAEPSSRAQN